MGTYNGTILLGAVWLFSSNLWLAAARRPEGRRSGADALEIIAWREVYKYLENCADACENVADVVEGVIMDNT